MSFVQLVVVLVVTGLAMWLINTYIPMQSSIRKILNIVVIILVLLYVLAAFGVIGEFTRVRVLR